MSGEQRDGQILFLGRQFTRPVPTRFAGLQSNGVRSLRTFIPPIRSVDSIGWVMISAICEHLLGRMVVQEIKASMEKGERVHY